MFSFLAERLLPFFSAISFVLLFVVAVPCNLFAQKVSSNVSSKANSPAASKPVVSVAFPKIEEFRLKNGLKAIVSENKAADKTTLLIVFSGGASIDAAPKAGSSAVLAKSLELDLQERFAELTKAGSLQVASEASPDALWVKATFSPQLLNQVLPVLNDALTRPSLLASETNAARSTYLRDVQKSAPNKHGSGVARMMLTKVAFGADHLYSKIPTPKTLQALTEKDVQAAHAALCMPNNATVVIVGNHTKKNLQAAFTKEFGAWKAGDAPYFPRPRQLPLENGVFALELPHSEESQGQASNQGSHQGSNQGFNQGSTKNLVPLVLAFDAPPRNDMDYEASLLAHTVLEARLRKMFEGNSTLESAPEKVFVQMTAHRYGNLLFVQGLVSLPALTAGKISQTASSEMLGFVEKTRDEIKRLSAAPADAQELTAAKELLLKRLHFAPVNSIDYASILAEAVLNDISQKDVSAFPKRLQSLSAEAVQTAVSRYFSMERGIAVIADSVHLAALMPVLKTLGKVLRYNLNGEQIVSFEKSDISLQKLLELHHAALGGTAATSSVQSLTTKAQTQLSAMAQKFPGTILTQQKLPNKIARKLEITATQILQELWCDGISAFDKIEMMGQEQPLMKRSEKELESAIFDAQIFPALTMQSCGFVPELQGKRDGNYYVKATTKSGTVKTLIFDGNTYLLAAIEELRQTPQGIIQAVQEFREYGAFDGVKLPTTVVLKTGPGLLIGKNSYELNPAISDAVFQAPK